MHSNRNSIIILLEMQNIPTPKTNLPKLNNPIPSSHTTESHCCRYLKTNKPLRLSEKNRSSRELFLYKLFKREIGQ